MKTRLTAPEFVSKNETPLATPYLRAKLPAGSLGDVGGMERVKGIEPSYAAWEAAVLPLNYTRVGPLIGRLR